MIHTFGRHGLKNQFGQYVSEHLFNNIKVISEGTIKKVVSHASRYKHSFNIFL